MTLAFLSECIRAFDRPSRMASLPQMVPKGDIPNAVAVGGTIWQLNRLAGPAVAGLLIYLIGIGPTYYFCCFASLSAVCLWVGIRFEHQPTAVSSGGLLQHMMDGLNFIWKNEIFLYLHQHDLLQQRLWHVLSNSDAGVRTGRTHCGLPRLRLFAKRGGLGALCGVLAVAYFSRSRPKGRQAIGGASIFGILLICFALSKSYHLSLILACSLGIASQFYITVINAILQV